MSEEEVGGLYAEISDLGDEIERLRKALESVQYELYNDGSMSEIAWIAEEALTHGEENTAL